MPPACLTLLLIFIINDWFCLFSNSINSKVKNDLYPAIVAIIIYTYTQYIHTIQIDCIILNELLHIDINHSDDYHKCQRITHIIYFIVTIAQVFICMLVLICLLYYLLKVFVIIPNFLWRFALFCSVFISYILTLYNVQAFRIITYPWQNDVFMMQ